MKKVFAFILLVLPVLVMMGETSPYRSPWGYITGRGRLDHEGLNVTNVNVFTSSGENVVAIDTSGSLYVLDTLSVPRFDVLPTEDAVGIRDSMSDYKVSVQLDVLYLHNPILSGTDEAYDATGWNGDLGVPSRNTVRDKFESYASDTVTFTGKTIDGSGTGNVLKFKQYLYLRGFDQVTGALPVNTNDYTAITFMKPRFLNGTDKASNYIEWRTHVPEDIDTSVALRARVKFRLTNSDTGGHRYVLSFASVADSASAAGSPSTEINLDFAGDGSGASGDVESVTWTTLTSWAGSLTAGQLWVVRLARDGDTSDSSTVDSDFVELAIEYGATQ